MSLANELIEQVLMGQHPSDVVGNHFETTSLCEDEDVTDRMAKEISFGPLEPHFRNLKPATSLTPARKKVLDKYDGHEMGFVSKAPLYDRSLRGLKKTEHKTLIALILGKKMKVIKRKGPLPGDHPISRVGADALYHYVLKKA